MPALFVILKPLLAGLGGVALRMVLAALSGPVIESAILQMLDYLVSKYEKRAAISEEKDDDERAKRARNLFNLFQAVLLEAPKLEVK